MADYDSDSSADGADIQTNVLLGYASEEPTGDDFSQLGGLPTWLDGVTAPLGSFAKCRVCNGIANLLLQLNGDLPDWFPGHDRRLYVFGCKRRACRRRDGSIRALRAVRASKNESSAPLTVDKTNGTTGTKAATNIGETIFGVKSPTPAQANPFASASSSSGPTNPFSTKPSGEQSAPATQPISITALTETFAQKASISTPRAPESASTPPESWPEDPTPYPSSYLDADKEYLEAETSPDTSNARLDTSEGSSSAADDKAAFESSMDKVFQRFADRLNQNPEQVLRYEFGGQPLLYAKDDAVGKLLAPNEAKVQTASSSRNGYPGGSRIPRCGNCGAGRVFEFQLTPNAITELEREDEGLDGMDWGTVIVAVCSEDCLGNGRGEDEVRYVEEWVGVQWEEIADGRVR